MKLRLREFELYERDVVLRLPFRFGVVTLREAPQLLLRARVELEGGSTGWGCSAELLSPKWFDKNPELSNADNFEQLRQSVRTATQLYLQRKPRTAFDLFAACYRPQLEACGDQRLNPLIACYGPALLDRAILDALCKLQGISFFTAIRRNLPGLRVTPDISDLEGFDLTAFLSGLNPLPSIHARHTVGLIDPIWTREVAERERVNDGLPETLEQVVQTYGNRYFKVKLSGNLQHDFERIQSIADLLDRRLDVPYWITLDGNEQYPSLSDVNDLLARIEGTPELSRFRKSILFLEQPLARDVALCASVSGFRLPLIIDESDATLEAFPLARGKGYRGISSKACKGLYKSFINLARCSLWNQAAAPPHFFMSAEDLSVQPGVSLQQDQAMVALLGLSHAERNGHHYVHGMAGASPREQAAFLQAHPDLYRPGTQGPICVRIDNGQMSARSLHCPGFAAAAEPDWETLRPVA